MNEYLFLFLIFLIMLIPTWVFSKLNKKTTILKYSIVSILYLFSIEIIFECANQIHIFLRNNSIYIELGHASLLLIFFNLIILIFAFCFIIWNWFKKR